MTVAVSIASGVAAITSAYLSMQPATVWIGVGVIVILLAGNLRGVSQAGGYVRRTDVRLHRSDRRPLATGIISTGTFLLGPSWLSGALLGAASAGLVVLGAALTARLVFFHSSVAADIKAPDRVFGFFTITADLDVLGVRLALAGHPLATAILAGLALADRAARPSRRRAMVS